MKKLIIVAAALALAGCVSAPATQKPAGPVKARVPVHLSAADMELVKAGVQSRLKDPNSAMFSTIVATSQQGGKVIAICGLVNAKNSFGGYTGSQLFHTLSFRRKDGTLDIMPGMISINDYVAEKMSANCIL